MSETVSRLARPGQCSRLLVSGSGAARNTLQIIENFYYDPRDKIIIFPTGNIADDFLGTLLYSSEFYKNALEKIFPDEITFEKLKRKLAFPSEIPSTLLAIGYAEATAGCGGDANPFDNTVVIFIGCEFVLQQSKIAKALFDSQNCALFALTDAHIFNVESHHKMCKIVKGQEFARFDNDKFYLFYPPMKSNAYNIGRVMKVPLQGKSETKYIEMMLEKDSIIDDRRRLRELSVYSCISTKYQQANTSRWMNRLALNPISRSTKLSAVREFVQNENALMDNILLIYLNSELAGSINKIFETSPYHNITTTINDICCTLLTTREDDYSSDNVDIVSKLIFIDIPNVKQYVMIMNAVGLRNISEKVMFVSEIKNNNTCDEILLKALRKSIAEQVIQEDILHGKALNK